MRGQLVVILIGGLALLDCGSGKPGGGGGGITPAKDVFSCDFTLGGTHTCADYSWSGGAYSTSTWQQGCTSSMGKAGTGCVTTSAVGGCTVTTTSGAITITTTTWFYMGTVASAMMACNLTHGTWMAPDAGSPPDMAMMGGQMDAAVPPPDLAMGGQGTGVTGDPCTQSGDCAPSTFNGANQAVCIKTAKLGGVNVPYTGGSCSSPCHNAKTAQDGTNPECPSPAAICASTGGTFGACQPLCATVADCRDSYVCAFAFGVASPGCIPIGASLCDPPSDPRAQGKSCGNGQTCVSYSPDNSYGSCATSCDPLNQNCQPPMMGMNGCVVDLQSANGSGECISISGFPEGQACHFLNDCDAGLLCFNQVCRRYCRTGGAACPNGQKCSDIVFNGITIKFHANTTGVCHP